MQLICLYSLTVCHTERRGTSKKDEENIFLRIIHLFYFFFPVLVGEYWRPVFLKHRTHEITESCWFVLSTSERKPPVQQDPPELPLLTPINVYLWHDSAEKGTNPASDRIYDAHGSSPWGGSGQSSPTVRPGFPLCSSLPFSGTGCSPFCRTWSWAGQSQLVQGPETLLHAGSHLRFTLWFQFLFLGEPESIWQPAGMSTPEGDISQTSVLNI